MEYNINHIIVMEEIMKKILLILPLLFACAAQKAADGETCTADDGCESGLCHIETDATEGVCEAEEGHDDEEGGDTAE